MKTSLTRWDDAETHAASTLAWQPAEPGIQDSVQAAPRRSGDSILQSLMRLWPRDGRRPQASARAMAELRAAFRAALADLGSPVEGADGAEDAEDQDQRLREILRHIVHSRDPQDLWHLRAAIYTEVARARSQGEAERRLAELGQHFKSSKRRFALWFGA